MTKTIGPLPRGVKMVPVPAPFCGPTLATIDSITELKVTLRVLWHVNQQRGVPRPVPTDQLLSDRTLAEALHLSAAPFEHAVRAALQDAAEHGTVFARTDPSTSEELIFLNSVSEREGADRRYPLTNASAKGRPNPAHGSNGIRWDAPLDTPTVFEVYEQNIAPLTPIIGEQISGAIQDYSESWIKEAIEIAVEHNVRNWKYISAILRRWHDEGKGHGESRRDPAEDRSEAYWRSYGKYLS